jgi:hypothetical protein
MRSFTCGHCGQLVFFENSVCLRCGAALGFLPAQREIVPLATVAVAGLRLCANATTAECNWLVVRGDPQPELCDSCKLTRTRPADGEAEALRAFAKAEAAKRRLIFQLLDLGLPIGTDLRFDLLWPGGDEHVVTGHDSGVITIDLGEGDEARRVARREDLGEPYRTLLGHFRHEIGHYYWQLVDRPDAIDSWRSLFGDERAGYGEALGRYHAGGPPAGWEQRHVSAYAAAHPWEDWAETFAHYLHIRDTLQTTAAFGMFVAGPAAPPSAGLSAAPARDADELAFDELIAQWLPFTYALNAVNRSMGRADLYPFTLPPAVIEKLSYVHDLVRPPNSGQSSEPGIAGISSTFSFALR